MIGSVVAVADDVVVMTTGLRLNCFDLKETKNVAKDDITNQASEYNFLSQKGTICTHLCSDLLQEVSSFSLLCVGTLFLLPDIILQMGL